MVTIRSQTIYDTTPDNSIEAIIGGHLLQIDIFTIFYRYDADIVNSFLTSQAIADYVRFYRRDLLPGDDPSGNPPSNHTIASVFKASYKCDSLVKFQYLVWAQAQNV